jgi:Polyketide cyclase / dehydrase and lipid transport
MAVRPDPEVGFRRPGDHRRADGVVERRVFVQASPRIVWATLHDPAVTSALYPEIRFGPAAPSWPAASTTRAASTRLGLLREAARVESLEARPDARFRVRMNGSGFESEWSWHLEPVSGGTRVIHSASFEPFDRWTGILIRLGRSSSLGGRVETHLRVLKERAEAAQRSTNTAA